MSVWSSVLTYLQQLETALGRSPITALLGPRQCGKTTLARQLAETRKATIFDLDSEPDVRRLANPTSWSWASWTGSSCLDEIQHLPRLFSTLSSCPGGPARLRGRDSSILGSASPELVRGVSESLAGRVEFVELSGFDLGETGPETLRRLWVRGGLPRSYLAASDDDSIAWREGFVRTFLERDVPQLGIRIPAAAMRRFWSMLAHWHGQTWNASELGRALGASDKTVRGYLDLLTGTYMVRQLQPWFENVAKRQVKAPKIYFRDTGLLHALLGIPDAMALLGHPRVGASWEGFAIEQILRALRYRDAWFWGAHAGNSRRAGSDGGGARPAHRLRGEVQRGAAGDEGDANRHGDACARSPVHRVPHPRGVSEVDHGITVLPDTEVVDRLRARIASSLKARDSCRHSRRRDPPEHGSEVFRRCRSSGAWRGHVHPPESVDCAGAARIGCGIP